MPSPLSPAEVLAVMEDLRLLAKPHMLVSDHERYVAAYMAIQSAFAELEARQWRPISEAPLDGHDFMAAGQLADGSWVVWPARFNVELGKIAGRGTLATGFTHWQPMLSPPREPV